MSGVKYDTGKADMGLLFVEVPYALEETSKALQMGSEKYGVGNWLKVENGEERYLSALIRHLTAYHQGEKLDKESGLSHLAHAAVNALFILDLETRYDYNSLQERRSCIGLPNDSWVAAEVGQIQKDFHSPKLDNSGAESNGVCSSGERIKSARVESCPRGRLRRAIYAGQQGRLLGNRSN